MNDSPSRAPSLPRPGIQALLAGLLLCGGLVSGLACLETGTVPQLSHDCSCSGIRCLNGIVGKLSHSSDEEAGPCSGCHVQEIARCAEGCAPARASTSGREECPVAYTCRAWEQVAEGTACRATFDCEPGVKAGAPLNTLACVEGACRDVGAEKWPQPVAPARECEGDPIFGPHPQCDGAPCLGSELYPKEQKRYCSVARCLEDRDCPSKWRCSCREEYGSDGLRAHRWCVPDFDAGFPEEAIVPLPSSN